MSSWQVVVWAEVRFPAGPLLSPLLATYLGSFPGDVSWTFEVSEDLRRLTGTTEPIGDHSEEAAFLMAVSSWDTLTKGLSLKPLESTITKAA